MTEVLSYAALESVFDWRLFAAVCGVRLGTPEAAAALEEFREEALSYIAAARPEARCAVEFFDCATDGGSLFSSDGSLVLPMLRQSGGRSLCDYFPSVGSGRTAPLGLFAVCVPDVDASGPAGSFMAADAAPGLPAEGTCSELTASKPAVLPPEELRSQACGLLTSAPPSAYGVVSDHLYSPGPSPCPCPGVDRSSGGSLPADAGQPYTSSSVAGAASGLPAEGTCSELPASGASWVPTGCAGPRRVTPCGQSSASSLCAGRPEVAPAAFSCRTGQLEAEDFALRAHPTTGFAGGPPAINRGWLGPLAPTGQSGQLEEWNPVIGYAVRATMAEAASDFLRRRFAEASGLSTIMPAIGYPCCPDHSLKRDVLSRLDVGIKLTESCAMVPETSVCGLVVSAPGAEYFDVRKVDERELERYCAARSFSAEDRRVFLYDFCSE